VDARQVAVLDEAAQHAAPRDPLPRASQRLLDLRTADRDLDRHVLAELVAMSELRGEGAVEEEEDFLAQSRTSICLPTVQNADLAKTRTTVAFWTFIVPFPDGPGGNLTNPPVAISS
jgi:hypothetical protein